LERVGCHTVVFSAVSHPCTLRHVDVLEEILKISSSIRLPETILADGFIDLDQGGNRISLSVALRWSSGMYQESIISFCNNIHTNDGESHEDGVKACLTRTVNQMSKKV